MRRRKEGYSLHLWETSVEAKEESLVLMLTCWRSLVVTKVFLVFSSEGFGELEELYQLVISCEYAQVLHFYHMYMNFSVV
jgi:hypothetical protein